MVKNAAAIVLFLTLAGASGCAGTFTEIPAGASVFRCTEYNGQGATPMTGTAISAEGFQCIKSGDGFDQSEVE